MAKQPVKKVGFPQNPSATELDQYPDFFGQKQVALTMTVSQIAQFSVEDLRRIRNVPPFFDDIPKPVAAEIDRRIANNAQPVASELSLVKVTSLAARAMEMESVRAQIPAEDIIRMLLTSAVTGQMNGVEIDVKTRTDILLKLLNKTLPDSKSIEIDERADKGDRKRRSLADMTKAELSKMPEEELRQIMQEEAERQRSLAK